MNSFEASVKAALDGWPWGTVFLAAVSGGADSTAMLVALAALRKETGFRVRVLHVEHGIRPPEESREDALAVVELCKNLKVSCRVVSIPPGRISRAGVEWGLGTEAAARFFRHRAWNREARRIRAARILVAHTRDDALETCLMRVLRGSGPAGLALMPRERGRILRPLLNLTRADVLAFLKSQGISFRIDSTNRDTRFLRNRIRHILIPCLDSFFPSWRSSLIGLAETQVLAAAFISAEAQKRVVWNPDKSGALSAQEGLWTEAGSFFTEPSIIQEEGIFLAADTLASGTPAAGHTPFPRRSSLRGLLRGLKQGSLKAGDLGKIRLEIQDDKIIARKTRHCDFEWGFSFLIDAPGLYTLKKQNSIEFLEFQSLKIKVESPDQQESLDQKSLDQKSFDQDPSGPYNSLERKFFYASLPVVCRPWRKKDFITRAGHTRYLSDIINGESRAVYSGFITVEDRNGSTAFIGVRVQLTNRLEDQKDPLLLVSDDTHRPGDCRFFIEIE